ncbi:MAG: nuclear transport factor 2 family protein [Comamonadaceae bacterium]|nr:MAG: nuclear transport factor 2 family protein [Comamonadaceae bacterium]
MKLPIPIQAYFDADRQGDGQAVAATFQPGAVVRDEGRTHAGRAAIRAWWEDAKARTPHVADPLEAVSDGSTTTVRARVSGAFPGSPVVLSFAFRLEEDCISALEITP